MSGSVQNLNEGRNEALQALRNISDELKDILGDGSLGDGTRRNENGELVNEEGLPIVDISEPVDDLETPPLTDATDDIMEDSFPKRLSQLSLEARAIERARQNKILLMLEEEEERETNRSREETLLERQHQKERAQKEMQKRMVNQAKELEGRKRAKEFEKKMAKALVGGLAESQTQTSADAELKKKTVSFADPPFQRSEHPSSESKHFGSTWGDAVSGRVPTRDRFTGAPMKTEVFERRTPKSNVNESISQINHAGQSRTPETSMLTPPQETLNFKDSLKDSDDESESDAASVSIDVEDGDVVLSAQHHRDLALEYHRRREALIANAKSFPVEERFLEGKRLDPVDWDREDVPLEATLAHPPPKPSISKFKSSMVEKKAPLVTSSSNSNMVLPPTALANSVRMGKLIDDKLVASPADEEEIDKEEEEIRKLLLRSMSQYAEIALQTIGERGLTPERTAPPNLPSTLQSNAKPKPKASRFKVNRSQMDTTATPIENCLTAQPTGNSGSKAQMARGQSSSNMTLSARTAAMSSRSIIDSPSPPSTTSYNTAINISSKQASRSLLPSLEQPMVIDSPLSMQPASFTKVPLHMSPPMVDGKQRTETSEPQQPLQATDKAIPAPERRSTVIPDPSARSSIRTGSVMSNIVKERVIDRYHVNGDDTRTNPKKMSRFKAEHGQS